MLTAEQKAFFDTFGFLVMRQLFTSAETATIAETADHILADDRKGRSFEGSRRQNVAAFMEKPSLRWLSEDDRIFLTLTDLLEPGFVWIASGGSLWVGDTLWHPDGSQLTYQRIKVAFYLDSVTKDTGCLRVIPGSHRAPFHDALLPLLTQRSDPTASPFGVMPRDVPSHAIETEPGDVIFFEENLWHASFGGAAGRRQFSVTVGENPRTPEKRADLQRIYQNSLETTRRLHSPTQDPWDGTLHDESFLACDRPRIRAMVSKLVELGMR